VRDFTLIRYAGQFEDNATVNVGRSFWPNGRIREESRSLVNGVEFKRVYGNYGDIENYVTKTNEPSPKE
jgi:hypothetical protein